LFLRCDFKVTLITFCFIPTNSLEINKLNFVVGHGTVVQLGCTTVLSDYGTNKYSSIAEHINWVLSELSVGMHEMVNPIGRTRISLLNKTHRF